MESVEPRSSWTFLTNHARILAMILRDSEIRLRDLASSCQLTERAAGAIVRDLETAGYLTRVRRGRRNHYEVTPGTLFRHPAEGHHEIANLLHLLVGLDPRAEPAASTNRMADPPPRAGPGPAMPPRPARPSSRGIGV
ncbi:AsnC family transcriptional regulator [Streptomyces sp. NPDC046876]|uniref:helix-turn-helix transcriptional regulator n=1 Tax=Streptomyces sp. NPDC046876 TaxID=3155616 RepID=UPI003406756F